MGFGLKVKGGSADWGFILNGSVESRLMLNAVDDKIECRVNKMARFDNIIDFVIGLFDFLLKKKPQERIPVICPGCGNKTNIKDRVTLRFCKKHLNKILNISDDKARAKKLKNSIKEYRRKGWGFCSYPNCKEKGSMEPPQSRGFVCKGCGYTELYGLPTMI